MITSKDEGLNSVARKAFLLGGIFVDQRLVRPQNQPVAPASEGEPI